MGNKYIINRPFFDNIWKLTFFSIFFHSLSTNGVNSIPSYLGDSILYAPCYIIIAFTPFKFKEFLFVCLSQTVIFIAFKFNFSEEIVLQYTFGLSIITGIFFATSFPIHQMLKRESIYQYEKDKALKKAYKSDIKFRELFDISGVNRAILDQNGNIIDSNQSWKTTFKKQYLGIGRNATFLLHLLSKEKPTSFYSYLKKNQFQINIDNLRLPLKITHKPDLIFRFLIWYNKELNFFIINILDSTQEVLEKNRYHQQEKLAHLGLSAAGLAHEIFNPLSSIILNIELLRENILLPKKLYNTKLKEEQNELLEKTLEGTEVIKILVNKFKSFSKVLNSQNQNNSLLEVIYLAKEMFLLPLKENINFKITNELNSNILIEDSRNNFFQVFLNLFSNSFRSYKVKPNTQKIIKIESEILEGNKIKLLVKDFGKGIEKENIKNVFDILYSTKKEDENSGLGLFLTKEAIENIGGSIVIESQINVFTEVTIVLPFTLKKEKKAYHPKLIKADQKNLTKKASDSSFI